MRFAFLGSAGLITSLFTATAAAEPLFLSREVSLVSKVPKEAFEGVGSWQEGGSFVATGHSISIDALGEAKGKRVERDIAEDDARARITKLAALASEASFDPGAYQVESTISGFQTVATYRLADREGVFLVGLARGDDVSVRVTFDLAKARRSAISAFDSGDYGRAARLFAAVTSRGAQDPETAALAHASSAHVNLNAGVTGPARITALTNLAGFYLQRGDSEEALRYSYDLYRETPSPDRGLLERLAELSLKTHRANNAAAFKQEIEKRWPASVSR